MLFVRWVRAGILFAVAAAGAISCGDDGATLPDHSTSVVAVQAFEQYLNSAQQESRELLIDSRVTDIEWSITGSPVIILLEGDGEGGNYYVSVRSLWTKDRFNDPDGFYLLLQWPDRVENRLEEPLVTSARVLAIEADTVITTNPPDTTYIAPGDTLIDCTTTGPTGSSPNTLVNESSWSRSSLQEDEVTIEIFSDSMGSYPADVWRWGAETTDPATPVNCTEFIGACIDGDDFGSNDHPGAGYLEDLYDTGGGPVRDAGAWTYMLSNHNPGSNVPLRIASKGTRDSRLNRAKPIEYVLWETVSKPMTACEINNPIREDNAGERDKTWNPDDYVPSFRLTLPEHHSSQADVIGKGAWSAGKWGLEIRRDLVAAPPDSAGVPAMPWTDDVPLIPGRRYVMRLTFFEGATGATSRSGLIPLYLRP